MPPCAGARASTVITLAEVYHGGVLWQNGGFSGREAWYWKNVEGISEGVQFLTRSEFPPSSKGEIKGKKLDPESSFRLRFGLRQGFDRQENYAGQAG